MDRIKQALAKARQGAGPAWQPVTVRKRTGLTLLESFEYTRTRAAVLDPALMNRNRIVALNKRDPYSSVFDVLRTKILRKMDDNGWHTLAVTSPTPGSGKTVVSINLAMSVAQQTDRTALLVDLDLRRPKVASYLGLTGGRSLNDVLRGSAAVSEAMVNPGIPRLVVIPTYESEPSPAEALSSQRGRALIKEMRDRYSDRVVILDLPPLLHTDDAITVLPDIDCVLLVIGNGEASKAEIEDSLRNLPALNIVGVVLNKAEASGGSYY